MTTTVPLDGDVLLLAGARASVTPNQLPDLVHRAQSYLVQRTAEYDRRFECIYDDADRSVFLVPKDHWAELGSELELENREADALRRAHEQQLLRIGTKHGRRDEFESAMEIREAVVVGR
ncbi:hypothetical protein C499_09534 [Halogeometricum borinquense DSM 11551]|uniref:DUF8048 domain-containing protein n=2 Tax=Halogeometricum borinquense TaxID=60847 RepID=E4NMQ6_HALBP|nr:hypothetical protein [Halogeometricum borinquense]ADQ66211.1 hypothetical protein Hbor_06110 [Halogeometricum borinquense DSM 11551]ELY27294.1 hypothetical protein C499_09534 [Halogeometricum borinquense DSM 11551]RYJ14756.1 hypothetical protein ELS19_12875 [Halogeometricum borinquense]